MQIQASRHSPAPPRPEIAALMPPSARARGFVRNPQVDPQWWRDQLSKIRENALGCSFNWAMLISLALLKGADLVLFPPIRAAVLGLFHFP